MPVVQCCSGLFNCVTFLLCLRRLLSLMCSTFWCTFLAALTRNPNLLLLVPAVATAVVEVAASEAISGATQLLMMKNARSKNVNTVQRGIGATTAATKNALAICDGSTMAVDIRYHDDDDCVPTKARNNAVAAIFVVMCRCCDVLLHVTRSLFVMIEPHQITL